MKTDIFRKLTDTIRDFTIAKNVEGCLDDLEAITLYVLAANLDLEGDIVEIGSYKGKSTTVFAKALKTSRKPGKVIAVDHHRGSIEFRTGPNWNGSTLGEFRENVRKSDVEDLVEPLVLDSRSASKEWGLRSYNKIKLLFIDGSHDFDSVKADFDLWKDYLVEDGILVFHDSTSNTGVVPFLEQYIWNPNSDYDWCIVKSLTIARKKKERK